MNQYEKVQLTEVLKFLEKDEEGDKPFLFINPSGALETFFKYKGNMKSFPELSQKLESDISMKGSIKSELCGMFETGMQLGYWTVINMESNPNFKLLEFLNQFDFKEDMLLPSRIKCKDYCLSQNILRKENDKDFDGNTGYFQIQNTFKLILLSTIKEDQIEELLKNNPFLNTNIIIVQ